MPYTRPQIETALVGLCGAKLAYAKLDRVTQDGTNKSLAIPIAAALRSLGIEPADPIDPSDLDLVAVPGPRSQQLLDIAELMTLEMVLGNRASPDQTADIDNTQAHGKFYDSLEATIARKQERCQLKYGYGLPALGRGTFDLRISPRFRGRR